jgi:hypothetical protein
LPPQCRGKDAFGALTQFLSGEDVLAVLEQLRKEFLASHPSLAKENEDYGFLLAAMGAYPEHQSLPRPSDHNKTTRDDDL